MRLHPFLLLLTALVSTTHHTSGLKRTPFPCKAPLVATPPCSPCSLKEWAQKIFTLKERPIQFSSLPTKKAYQHTILTLTEFIETLQECATTQVCCCKTDTLWLNKKSIYTLAPEIFTLERPYTKPADSIDNFTFKPFTIRLRTKPGTICALFGDLHGSIHSLMRDLLKLQELGYLDDTFKIVKNNFNILFFGDYIDRGIYGVEVVYTLARLKIANPTQVFLIRGNHEDYLLAPDFKKRHTKEEEKDNTPSFIDELYAKFDLSEKDEVTIFRFYETLPVALYLGCGTVRHEDYMMCCHGGLELGYNPYNLLHADPTIQYELIDKLWRKKHFNQKLAKNYQDSIKLHFNLDILCGDIQDLVPRAPFFQTTPSHTTYLGFLWNDFYVDPLKSVGQRGKMRFTGWVYGRDLTQELLSWGSSKKVTLQGIFRGHQHNNETGGPLLDLLCCTRGMVKVWKNNNLYTLISAPDSKLEDTGQNCFTYDSFVLLTTAPHFKNWRILHYTQDNGMENKKWNVTKLN